MREEALISIIEALKAGEKPMLDPADFTCLAPGSKALAGKENVGQAQVDALIASLSTADIPTFERALQAVRQNELAWLGFKLVYDPAAAISNVDNDVTTTYGQTGSADGDPLVFFCNDAREIVASRPYSPRDLFQMTDITRGPAMHNDQFAGLTWVSEAVLDRVHVWILGGTDAAAETAALASHVDFRVTAIDYDPAYLNEERFPTAERVLLDGDNFDGLANIEPSPNDFVCVLTRGHMFDPQGCVWAAQHNVAYAGMMGHKSKNDVVKQLVLEQGVTEQQWDRIKRPIGLAFGAVTPAELAIAIVAELVDERYKLTHSAEVRQRHNDDLGR